MIGRYGILVLLALQLAVLPAGAEFRQWTDENGVKHFSNKKDLPEGVTVERSIEEKDSHPEDQRRYQKSDPAIPPQSRPAKTDQRQQVPNRDAALKKIRSCEARLREVFDRIYTKRRYVKRRGKQDIERIRRLNGEIEALEQSGADAARLKQVKEERAASEKRLFNENLRTRKGVGEDIQEYREIRTEIAELEKNL